MISLIYPDLWISYLKNFVRISGVSPEFLHCYFVVLFNDVALK